MACAMLCRSCSPAWWQRWCATVTPRLPSPSAADDDPIALDGKTVRGASAAGHTAPHLLSFCTHQSQEILLHVLVSEKSNEIPVAQALLPCLPLAGRVCTADAMHTQTDFLERVDAQGGKTVLAVKKNQATLHTSWRLCAISSSPSFIARGRTRLRTRGDNFPPIPSRLSSSFSTSDDPGYNSQTLPYRPK
jgi:predicted transposase YbfD/YdcC